MNPLPPMGRPPLPEATWRWRHAVLSTHLLSAEACVKLADAALQVNYNTALRWAAYLGFRTMWVSREERRHLLERRRHRRTAGHPVEAELQRPCRAA